MAFRSIGSLEIRSMFVLEYKSNFKLKQWSPVIFDLLTCD